MSFRMPILLHTLQHETVVSGNMINLIQLDFLYICAREFFFQSHSERCWGGPMADSQAQNQAQMRPENMVNFYTNNAVTHTIRKYD